MAHFKTGTGFIVRLFFSFLLFFFASSAFAVQSCSIDGFSSLGSSSNPQSLCAALGPQCAGPLWGNGANCTCNGGPGPVISCVEVTPSPTPLPPSPTPTPGPCAEEGAKGFFYGSVPGNQEGSNYICKNSCAFTKGANICIHNIYTNPACREPGGASPYCTYHCIGFASSTGKSCGEIEGQQDSTGASAGGGIVVDLGNSPPRLPPTPVPATPVPTPVPVPDATPVPTLPPTPHPTPDPTMCPDGQELVRFAGQWACQTVPPPNAPTAPPGGPTRLPTVAPGDTDGPAGPGGNGGAGGGPGSGGTGGAGGAGGTGGQGGSGAGGELELYTCGLPGKPPCKIDESGTPIGLVESASWLGQIGAIFKTQDENLEKIKGKADKDTSWTITPAFLQKKECSPWNFGTFAKINVSFVVDICPHIHYAQAAINVIAFFFTFLSVTGMVFTTLTRGS